MECIIIGVATLGWFVNKEKKIINESIEKKSPTVIILEYLLKLSLILVPKLVTNTNFAFYKGLFFKIKNLKLVVFKSRMCFSESKAFDKSIIIVPIVCTLFSIVRRVSITLRRFLKYFRKNRNSAYRSVFTVTSWASFLKNCCNNIYQNIWVLPDFHTSVERDRAFIMSTKNDQFRDPPSAKKVNRSTV